MTNLRQVTGACEYDSGLMAAIKKGGFWICRRQQGLRVHVTQFLRLRLTYTRLLVSDYNFCLHMHDARGTALNNFLPALLVHIGNAHLMLGVPIVEGWCLGGEIWLSFGRGLREKCVNYAIEK
jgi:hypothetical protein